MLLQELLLSMSRLITSTDYRRLKILVILLTKKKLSLPSKPMQVSQSKMVPKQSKDALVNKMPPYQIAQSNIIATRTSLSQYTTQGPRSIMVSSGSSFQTTTTRPNFSAWKLEFSRTLPPTSLSKSIGTRTAQFSLTTRWSSKLPKYHPTKLPLWRWSTPPTRPQKRRKSPPTPSSS